MQNFIISQSAPTIMIKYINKYISKEINKINKSLNNLHYYKHVTGTKFMIYEILEIITHLLMNTQYTFTIDEVQKRKHMARGLCNLLSKYV
jgi:chromosomal replication initiation ATPase DnaA